MPAVVISVVLCSLLVLSCIAAVRAIRDAIPYIHALARSVRAGFKAADEHSKVEKHRADYIAKARRGGIL